MHKIIKSLILAFTAFSMGCTKDADIKLPDYVPTLTVHSYISPKDSGMIVYVNLTKSAYSNNFIDLNNVTNATVKVSNGAISKTLAFVPAARADELSFYYIDSMDFKIEAGKTYTLNISTPDGKAATATTTVPQVVPDNTLEYHLVKTQFGDSVYHLKFTFFDPAGQDDYYKFGAYILEIDTTTDELNTSSNEEYQTYFSSDGNLITATIEAYRSSSFLQPEQIRVMDFRIMHVTREYYLYQLSIQNGGGGPFREPSVTFTNISGGVGVFAAYNYDQIFIRL